MFELETTADKLRETKSNHSMYVLINWYTAFVDYYFDVRVCLNIHTCMHAIGSTFVRKK
jgi:hypothetical protein